MGETLTTVTVDLINKDNKMAGKVKLELSYFELVQRDQLVQAKEANCGTLVGALMEDASEPICLRFRTVDRQEKLQWLMALRWMAGVVCLACART